jgi:hypothetical protein
VPRGGAQPTTIIYRRRRGCQGYGSLRSNGYLKAVCDYAHLNPVRAGLVGPEAALQIYPWSSYPDYLREPAGRTAWLRVDRLFGEWGIPTDSPAGREQFARRMKARRRASGCRFTTMK